MCAHADGATMSQFQCDHVVCQPAEGPREGQFRFNHSEIKIRQILAYKKLV